MLSIVIPFYNTSDKIINCLKSIKEQCNNDGISIIFVNDGSTDNTSKIINNFLNDSKIKFTIFNKLNGGVSSARNLGISHVATEYVMFLDSDDILLKGAISKIKKAILESNGKYNNIFFSYIPLNTELTPLRNDSYENIDISEFNCKIRFRAAFFSGEFVNHISVCSGVYRVVNLYQNGIEFDTTLHYAEDQLFTYNVACMSDNLFINKSILGYVIDTEYSAMGKFSPNRMDSIYVYRYFLSKVIEKELRLKIVKRINFEILIISKLAIKNLSLYNAYCFYRSNIKKEYIGIDNIEVSLEQSCLKITPFLYMLVHKVYHYIRTLKN